MYFLLLNKCCSSRFIITNSQLAFHQTRFPPIPPGLESARIDAAGTYNNNNNKNLFFQVKVNRQTSTVDHPTNATSPSTRVYIMRTCAHRIEWRLTQLLKSYLVLHETTTVHGRCSPYVLDLFVSKSHQKANMLNAHNHILAEMSKSSSLVKLTMSTNDELATSGCAEHVAIFFHKNGWRQRRARGPFKTGKGEKKT